MASRCIVGVCYVYTVDFKQPYPDVTAWLLMMMSEILVKVTNIH